MIEALHVPVLVQAGEVGVGHAQLLPLVDVGGAPHGVDDVGQHLGGLLPVLPLVTEPGHHPGLVVVAPEHGVPGVVGGHALLPGEENVLELAEVGGHQHPLVVAHEVHLQVVEGEDHGQLAAVCPGVAEAVLHGGGGHLAHRDDLRVLAEALTVQFMQKLVDARAVGVEAAAIPLKVIGVLPLADEVHHVEAEALHALTHPEAHNVLNFFPHGGVLPVQIRLGLVEEVEVVFAQLGHVLPGVAAELALPVGGWGAVGLAGAEDVVVLVHRVPGQGLLEPLVVGGGVVKHHVQHDADVMGLRLGHQFLEVGHGAIPRVNGPVIGHVVAVVVLGGDEEGGKPDVVHTQLLQVVQLGGDAL